MKRSVYSGYLEKVARTVERAAKTEETKTKDTLIAGGSFLGSAGLLSQVKPSDLTGRVTLYHGTNPRNVASILEEGIHPVTDKNATVTKNLKNLNNGVYEKSLGKTYMDKNKELALIYTRDDPLSYKEPVRANGLIEVKLPSWKFKQVMNPEADMPFEDFLKLKKKHTPFGIVVDMQVENEYNTLRNNHVIEGGVPAKYIKGSKHYKGVGLKELVEYAKAKPGTFFKEVGKVGGGLALLGGGVYTILKNRNKNK